VPGNRKIKHSVRGQSGPLGEKQVRPEGRGFQTRARGCLYFVAMDDVCREEVIRGEAERPWEMRSSYRQLPHSEAEGSRLRREAAAIAKGRFDEAHPLPALRAPKP